MRAFSKNIISKRLPDSFMLVSFLFLLRKGKNCSHAMNFRRAKKHTNYNHNSTKFQYSINRKNIVNDKLITVNGYFAVTMWNNVRAVKEMITYSREKLNIIS